MVALIGLAALGLGHVLREVSKRSDGRRWPRLLPVSLIVVVCAATIAELAPLPFMTSKFGATPAIYGAVARTPQGVLAEYPLTRGATPINSQYVFWQRSHGRPILNGAALNSDADAVRRMFVVPSAPGTARALALLGVTSIVTRPTTLDWDEATRRADLSSYGAGYALVDRDPSGARLWRVTAAPAPAIAAYGWDSVSEPVPPGASDAWYPLSGRTARIDLYAKRGSRVQLRFRARAGKGTAILVIRGEGARSRCR